MRNLGLILRLVRRITPQLDVKAVGDEIRERITDELDYELEAQNHRSMARLYRGHPFIVIPPVVTSVSSQRVLVTELLEGTGFEVLRKEPAEERNRIGEVIFRFYFGSMYRQGRFSGDPHPGNMMRLADGRIAFLDFGLFKTLQAPAVELELACQRAAAEGDAGELHRLFARRASCHGPRSSRRSRSWRTSTTRSRGTRRTPRSRSPPSWSTGPRSSRATLARRIFRPCATRTSIRNTSSAAGWSC